MNRAREERLVLVIFIIGLGLILGCSKKMQTLEATQAQPSPRKPEAPAPPPPAPEEPKPRIESPAPLPSAEAAPPAPKIEDVFFDFDKALIRSDGRSALGEDFRWLKENPNATITIEGHCDERGTEEYNLVLGERRAKALKQYLGELGIDSARIKTISYGEERPFCKAHNEQCWQENRRGHFNLVRAAKEN